jgi:16S rRNA (cytosine1402-N4)-methyltransferase
MKFSHVPVLFNETIENLNIRPDGIYVDGTLGGGGHSRGICERLGEDGLLIGIDRDRDALEAAQDNLKEFKCRKIFVHDNYSNIKRVLEGYQIERIDGAVLDLGVSSFQLDAEERGFSYMKPAPLDMRMDAESPFSAYDVVNTYSKKELTEIIRSYGEEKWASRISDFIVKARGPHCETPIATTDALTDIIKAAIPASARREGPHPAKRTFQAIRIEVNDELGGLRKAVDEFIDVLGPKGRLCIITFHSLEDRIVKEKFAYRANPCTCPRNLPCVCGKKPEIRKVSGKPIIPSGGEIESNPRSRSAKLRVVEKL